MAIHALFDSEGHPLAFYTDDIHSTIPDGCVEISKEEWVEFLSNNGRRVWRDGVIQEYTPTVEPAPDDESARLEQAANLLGLNKDVLQKLCAFANTL